MRKGFTLIELLIYITLLMIVGGIMGGIMLSVLRINTQQMSDNEIASQMNFVVKTVEQLVKQSSNAEISSTTSTAILKLRMTDPAKDPTCVSLVDGVIKLAQGHDAPTPSLCSSMTTNLTSSNVTVDNLNFKKIGFYPGHDVINIDLQMTFNSSNPQARVSRALHSGFTRVSAATFDDNVLPGSSGAYDIGTSGNLWRSINNLLYFSGNNVGIGITNPTTPLSVSGGDIYISNQGSGLILRDTNGTGCHRITVNASGTISAAIASCP